MKLTSRMMAGIRPKYEEHIQVL